MRVSYIIRVHLVHINFFSCFSNPNICSLQDQVLGIGCTILIYVKQCTYVNFFAFNYECSLKSK